MATFIGYAAYGADNGLLPGSYQPGDLAIVYAGVNGGTVPSLPAGWVNGGTASPGAGANAMSARCGTRVLQSGDTSTGVWTNAGEVQVEIWRDVALGSTIGNSSGVTANITTATVTLDVGDGSSIVTQLVRRRGATIANTFTTTGLPSNRSNGAANNRPADAAADTGSGVSSYTGETFISSGTTGWVVFGFELKSSLVAKSSSDTGAGTEGTPAISVTAAAGDTGTGTEGTPSVAATVAGTETGAGTDAGTIAAAVATSDTGTGTEGTPTITAPIGGSDTGVGAEGTPSVAAALAATDSGVGSDAQSLHIIWFAVIDGVLPALTSAATAGVPSFGDIGATLPFLIAAGLVHVDLPPVLGPIGAILPAFVSEISAEAFKPLIYHRRHDDAWQTDVLRSPDLLRRRS